MLVSTDIGGTDPDDCQSMVHLLLYADVLDIEGLVSSPPGPGRKEHILEVIDVYERDFASLRTHSDRYPHPEELRAITWQGETEVAPDAGTALPTAGSAAIVECARRDDPRPLHVLVWGGPEDLAQALHDAPDILPRLRVYWIGGPNKKWSPNAFQYLATHHPTLWIIEANSTYRGWFVGGRQDGGWGNRDFVTHSIQGRGALGTWFATHLKGTIKMGDTPSVAWLLHGATRSDPTQPGWGGSFVPAWERSPVRFNRVTTAADRMEVFGILELVLPLTPPAVRDPLPRLLIDNQPLDGFAPQDGTVRFRFSPKATGTYPYTIRCPGTPLDGLTGAITVIDPPPGTTAKVSPRHPNWWTDDPSQQWAEGVHRGARTVNRWREDYLADFASRIRRCSIPGAAAPSEPPRHRPSDLLPAKRDVRNL